MKKIIYTALPVLLLLFSACESKFLDLDPLDRQTEAAYFNKPEHFQAAANEFYNYLLSWKSVNSSNIFEFMDYGSDLTGMPQNIGRGIIAEQEIDKYWNNSYKYIRGTNVLLQKAAEYGGDKEEIASYIAEAKFFRAYHHFFLLQRFGGVPIVSRVLDVDSEELYGKRNSRYEVFAQVLSDLNDAIEDLPLEQNIGSDDKGHVSKWAAKAFKAKVLLFEATWERYVGETTDGDGATSGAGTAKPADYPSVETMLTEASVEAKQVMDNGGFSLWNYNGDLDNLSMCYLFNLEDAGSNPAGLDKTSNKEFIFYSKYDFALRQGGTNISHTVGTRLSPSRKMMDLFLCTDGLPISDSPLFQGYGDVSKEYQNRDYRMVSYFCDAETWTTPTSGSVTLEGPGGGSGVGVSARKFCSYNYGTYRESGEESFDYPHIRLAEVYLIYAEALFELNGALTDQELNESVNKVKARAGLPALTNAFAAANGLDIKEEIRRERAIELFAENSRFNDLKRWGIAEAVLNEPLYGPVIEGTAFDGNADLYTPNAYPFGEVTIETGVGQRRVILLDPDYNRNFQRKHYLYPLPTEQTRMNPNLKQNPDYL